MEHWPSQRVAAFVGCLAVFLSCLTTGGLIIWRTSGINSTVQTCVERLDRHSGQIKDLMNTDTTTATLLASIRARQEDMWTLMTGMHARQESDSKVMGNSNKILHGGLK